MGFRWNLFLPLVHLIIPVMFCFVTFSVCRLAFYFFYHFSSCLHFREGEEGMQFPVHSGSVDVWRLIDTALQNQKKGVVIKEGVRSKGRALGRISANKGVWHFKILECYKKCFILNSLFSSWSMKSAHTHKKGSLFLLFCIRLSCHTVARARMFIVLQFCVYKDITDRGRCTLL